MFTFASRTLSLFLVGSAVGLALSGCSSESGSLGDACTTCDGNGDPGSAQTPSDGGVSTSNGNGNGTGNGGGTVDGGGVTSCTGSGLSGITVSPSSLAFGSSTEGEDTTTSLLTAMNTTKSAIAIGSVALSGTNSGDFSQETDCPANLPAGKKCYVRVVFTP